MEGLEVKDYIAIYAALLSTVLALRQIWVGRRKVNVSSILTYDKGISVFVGAYRDSLPPMYEMLEIICVNRGYRPVEIIDLGLWSNFGAVPSLSRNIRHKGKIIQLPVILKDGERLVASYYMSEIEKLVQAPPRTPETPSIKLENGYVTDAEGREWYVKLPKDLKKRNISL